MNSKTNENNSLIFFLGPILFGFFGGLSVILILFVIFALILSGGFFSISTSSLFASVSVAIGAFVGGLISAKKAQKKGFLNGFLTGVFLFLVFSLISLIAFKTAPTTATLIRGLLFLLSGTIGGILGVGSSDKVKIS